MMKHFLLITIYLLIQSTGQRPSGNVDNSSTNIKPLMVSLPDLTLSGNTLEIFTSITRAGGMSGGIARILDGCTRGPQVPLAIKGGTTLGQALDLIAGNDTRSEWHIADGVVDMVPSGPVPPLLRVQIHGFKWDKNASAADGIARLRDSAEVAERARQLGLEMGTYEGSGSAICIRNCTKAPKSEPLWKAEEDATLLTLLNRVVQAHDRAIWAYSENHCGNTNSFLLETIAE